VSENVLYVANALPKAEGNHARRRATVTPDLGARDAEVASLPPPGLAARLSGAPPADDPIQRYRATLQSLPSNALRQRFVVALARQQGNTYLQRMLASVPARG
jgi:hypothetical protein